MLARRIDTEAFALQRHGEIGLWPPALGQEAAQIGSGRALRPQDFAFATYRDHGVAWCRGVEPADLLGWVRGVELGGWDPAEHGFGLPSIIIGAQTLHATGYAMGLTLDGAVGTGDPERDAAVIAYFGDGATQPGRRHGGVRLRGRPPRAGRLLLPEQPVRDQRPARPPDRGADRPARRAASASAASGSTATTCSPCHAVTDRGARSRRATAAARRSSRPSPTAWARTPRPTTPPATARPPRSRRGGPRTRSTASAPTSTAAGTPPQFFADLEAEAELLGEHLRERCAAMPEPDLAELFDHVYVEQTDELREQQAAYVAWRGQHEGSVA